MAKKNILVDIDFNQNQLLNPVLQNLSEDPSTGVEGQKYFNTTNHIERIYRDGAWQNGSDEYELPAASTNTRGGVKVGSHLNVTDTDVLNADEASTTQKGVVEIATDEEVATGTDTERAVTPHGLASALANLNIDDQSIDGRNEYRTLTKDEWDYLLNTRTASTVGGVSDARFAKAKVNDVNGLVIFPDTFNGGNYTWANINNKTANFTGNTITEAQWAKIETAGAIFLPCCGKRNGTTVSDVSGIGNYRCADRSGTGGSYLNFFSSNINLFSGSLNYFGYGVRLANTSRKGFTIGASVEVGITGGNLQYKASTDEWRFAPKAWIVVGNGNANIGENYNCWIDLFGYGTSGWSGSGAGAYQPWASDNISSYCAYNLTGDYDRADWGVWISRKIHADELPTATDTAKGVVELATNAETLAGTDTERAVTPSGLHSTKGSAGGIAELDINGKVPSSQLPSYVDDVIEGYLYNNHFYEDSSHTILSPADQESGKIFVDLQDNLSYRWSGSTYVEVSQSLALGETSSTAYRGDRGKVAYDHATDANRITTAQSSGLYKIAVTAEGHVASATPVVASDIPTQDATETQKGVAELATSAEAITGTDTERIMTPKTVKDAHDSRHWFGTQAEFDAIAPDYDPNVIYHVENTEDTGITLHWTDDVATLASNNQLVTGDIYAKLPTGDTDKRNITNLYMATSSSTYITLWNL